MAVSATSGSFRAFSKSWAAFSFAQSCIFSGLYLSAIQLFRNGLAIDQKSRPGQSCLPQPSILISVFWSSIKEGCIFRLNLLAESKIKSNNSPKFIFSKG